MLNISSKFLNRTSHSTYFSHFSHFTSKKLLNLIKFSTKTFSSNTSNPNPLILAIDQGTTSSRLALIDSSLKIIDKESKLHEQISLNQGWTEHNPLEIWDNLVEITKILYERNFSNFSRVKTISITNQRETTLCWNKKTGIPYHNAIVWHDTRTSSIVNKILAEGNDKDSLREKCGLPINTYFSASKIKWLIENVKEIKENLNNSDLCFGTIDSWLIYKLTGNHSTDVTNASRTMLMNLKTLQWDDELLSIFQIPKLNLPKIKSSSDNFGKISNKNLGCIVDIPITGVIGDQQSACVGHLLETGEVKNTYGTGCFILMNTGSKIAQSKHGLLTTVLYKNGDEDCLFALEGAVESAGRAINFMKHNLGLINDYNEMKSLFNSVKNNGGVFFITAFSGLFSPHWDNTARGMMIGLTSFTNKGHIVHSVFESISLRTLEVLTSIEKDSGILVKNLKVDGGMVTSNEFLQTQANILKKNVIRQSEHEITIIGSAIVAGLYKEVGIWNNFDDVKKAIKVDREFGSIWEDSYRNLVLKKWKKAVEKCKNWECEEEED